MFVLRRADIVLATALFVCALTTTDFWKSVQWLSSSESYSLKRAKVGFAGIDLDQARSSIDARVPASRPVWLEPRLEDSSYVLQNRAFVVQRLTEGLYPRVVEPGSSDFIEWKDLRVAAGGPIPSSASTASIWGALDALLSLALLGLLARWPARRLFAFEKVDISPAAFVPLIVLVGAAVIAVKTSAQSWLQLSWPGIFPGFGFLTLALVFPAVRSRLGWPALATKMTAYPERSVLALYLISLGVRAWMNPIVLWDARSIWFFAADRLHQHGMLAVADLTHVASTWSHPDYPLFYASLAAFFSTSTVVFSERMAAMCIPVLGFATLSLLWALSRRALGRWPGLLFTIAIALLTDGLTIGGYVDGFLSHLLLIEVLAFSAESTRGLAWLAVGCASLLKTEGLVLATAIAVMAESGRKGVPLRSRAIGFLVLGPAVVHRLWVGSLGVNSLFVNAPPGNDIATAFFPRVGQVLMEMPKILVGTTYIYLQPALSSGVAALVLAIGLQIKRGQKAVPSARLALLAGFATAAFAVGSISALPEDIHWFVWNTLDRLLLHPSLLFTLSALLAARLRVTGST